VFTESIASLYDAYFDQGPYKSWKSNSAVTHILDEELKR
jgi:hypothetical protein